jgi:GNAT superfamily N-acetyltransferase
MSFKYTRIFATFLTIALAADALGASIFAILPQTRLASSGHHPAFDTVALQETLISFAQRLLHHQSVGALYLAEESSDEVPSLKSLSDLATHSLPSGIERLSSNTEWGHVYRVSDYAALPASTQIAIRWGWKQTTGFNLELQTMLKGRTDLFILVSPSGQVEAAASVKRITPNYFHMDDFYVHPNLKGRGRGRILLTAMVGHWREHKIRQVHWLSTLEAYLFYENVLQGIVRYRQDGMEYYLYPAEPLRSGGHGLLTVGIGFLLGWGLLHANFSFSRQLASAA